jgi:UDP-4-amino-4-deoxy-L-arabinose-oxoglutarate aminotransferase
VHRQKYYQETMKIPTGVLPDTEWNSERICSLPLFPEMTHEDVDDVIDTIKDILRS